MSDRQPQGEITQRADRNIGRGRELGSYHLVDKLGEGGMGEVWLAEHRWLARPAAIKLVRSAMIEPANDTEVTGLLDKFRREAQATAVLNSPHTIDVLDFGLTPDGLFYYVMELLVGLSIESLVRQFGALPADRTTYLLQQVCHSLAEAHTRGLVHGDVKPANVYVCRMGLDYDFVKVLDFGLVRFSDRGRSSSQLAPDQLTTGTPAFMAPEIIMGASDIDPRADVYSLGCLAYWMLTGHFVFEENSSLKMMRAHVDRSPLPPSARSELPVPHKLDSLVLACLEKDPARRPQSAWELWQMSLAWSSRNTWSQPSAKGWWEAHLPQLTHPLVLAIPAVTPASEFPPITRL